MDVSRLCRGGSVAVAIPVKNKAEGNLYLKLELAYMLSELVGLSVSVKLIV